MCMCAWLHVHVCVSVCAWGAVGAVARGHVVVRREQEGATVSLDHVSETVEGPALYCVQIMVRRRACACCFLLPAACPALLRWRASAMLLC